MALRFSLPFLVSDIITFANSPHISPNTGYGLIGAFALVFIGLAVSSINLSFHNEKSSNNA